MLLFVHGRQLAGGFFLLLAMAATAGAQIEVSDRKGPRLGETVVARWRFGVIVSSGGGRCRGIVATTSVPTDWPEQQVRIVEEDISRGAMVSYRMVDEAVREMTVRIPSLPPAQEARAIVTFEVKRSWQIAPEDTELYVLPNRRKAARELRAFLSPSPHIESSSPQIKALVKQIPGEEAAAWRRVEAIYDWVRENVAFEDNRDQAVKDTRETLRDRTGDCDELSSLFIAICRAASIPARTVRVPGHCHAEFYLEDEEGTGHWFPCQLAGTRAFGEMPEHRPVLQKGDHLRLRDPVTRRTKSSRFLPDQLRIADHQSGSTPPRVQFVLEAVAD